MVTTRSVDRGFGTIGLVGRPGCKTCGGRCDVGLHGPASSTHHQRWTVRREYASGVAELAELDSKTLALVRLAGLVAVGGATASFSAHSDAAIGAGATPDEMVDVLLGVLSVVGLPRAVAAAPHLAMALGYDVEPPFRARTVDNVHFCRQGKTDVADDGDFSPNGPPAVLSWLPKVGSGLRGFVACVVASIIVVAAARPSTRWCCR